MRRFASAILASLCAALCGAEVPAPSADEVLALRLLNDFRADPIRGDYAITQAIERRQVPTDATGFALGWERGTKNRKKQLPVVFNPQLMAAARAVLAGKPKPPSGSALDAIGPMKEAGYPSTKSGSLLVAVDAPGIEVAFEAAMVGVVGQGSTKVGGKEHPVARFARESAMQPDWREAGVAVGGTPAKTTLVLILGAGSAARQLGGVVYADANRNRSYDPGEGRAGVTVTVGEATFTTAAGGAWWLGQAKAEAGEIRFAGAGFSTVVPLAKGTENVIADWPLPLPDDLKTADKLIADTEKSLKGIDDPAKQRSILAPVITRSVGLYLDDQRAQRLAALVGPVKADYELLVRETLSAFGEDPAVWKKHLATQRAQWGSALQAWFSEVEGLYQLRQQVRETQALPEKQRAAKAAGVAKQLDQALAKTVDPQLREQLMFWREEIGEILAAKEETSSGDDGKKNKKGEKGR